MADEKDESRSQPRLRLELPVEAQVNGGGYKDVQIVDISPTGLQLWTDDLAQFSDGGAQEFEVKFTARMAWTQPMEDRSFLTGWEIELSEISESS